MMYDVMYDSESSESSAENSGSDSGNDVPTENVEKLNSIIAEDRRKWIEAIKNYLTETQATSLDLSFSGPSKNHTKLEAEEMRSLFRILPNSHVTELSLDGNDMSKLLADLLQMLLSTNINKLDMYRSNLYNEEMMRLMTVLKDTRVTELSVSHGVFEISADEENEFISHLVASRLTYFNFDFGFFDPERDPDAWYGYPTVSPFLRAIPATTITNLNLSQFNYDDNTLSSLFSNLQNTAVTALSLIDCELKVKHVRKLSLYLRDSKLVSLILCNNRIKDAGIDALAVGLVHSKITTLDISDTSLTGANAFGLCLKDSQIKTLDVSNNDRIKSFVLLSFPGFLRYSSIVALDISYCKLGDKLGQTLMKSLQFSKITKLNVSSNNLQLLSATEFASIVKDTEVTDMELSYNHIPFDGIVILGNCLGGSKLKQIQLRENLFTEDHRIEPAAYSTFLERTKESPLESVDLANIALHADGMKTIVNSLMNTTFTHLDLGHNKIRDGAVNLAAQLKFTKITHLNLSSNELSDADGESLAKCLSETKITNLNLNHNMLGHVAAKAIANVLSDTRLIELDLGGNRITSCGAKALAFSLRNAKLLHLDLQRNQIENEGLEALAHRAEDTFLTVLDVRNNPGTRILLIERILLKNKGPVHHFVSFFKRIAPTSANNFRLDESVCHANVDVFLEECLVFYKTVLDQPSTISAIVQEESFSFSWDQVVLLLREEFPRQFATFVMKHVEATATQHVDFLKKVEELGLSKIVEILLLNRPALMIDEDEDILHPYVYLLLHKYKQPLYNSSIEPEGKTKIIQYFTEHSELEGAVEVINLLHNDKN